MICYRHGTARLAELGRGILVLLGTGAARHGDAAADCLLMSEDGSLPVIPACTTK